MRRLLYIPIIHEEADLGSAGSSLAQSTSTQVGGNRWALHQQTVQSFWEGIERYLDTFGPDTIRVYQDGLPADGALGRRIVEEAASRGSRNYRLILALLDRGAQLRATEDAALLLQEHASLRRAEQQQPCPRQREELLARRDAYIAGRINATLQEGEAGVLFIGAGHHVLSILADDIVVRRLKDPKKLSLYVQELVLGSDEGRLARLATYVATQVEDVDTEG